ncbi:hypothetical protein ACMA1D_21280 [Streptomyces sp. 796.1]|uniref:hypothetical protein n=1 Tax=Streptomyces sp. 796.1 TaxID=3163029 RepID=UPI0039C98162
MTTATVTASPTALTTSSFGTSPGSAAQPAAHCATASTPRARRPLGTAFRAVKVFASTAFSVAVLGDYEDAGVRRR